MDERLILGVDFDGTIVEEAFPKIGKIKQKTVDLMRVAYNAGHLIVVWTARSNGADELARQFLIENDIPFHFLNENPEDPYAKLGIQGRKIFCHYYIDDRAVHVDDIDKLFPIVGEKYQPKLWTNEGEL
jgi:hypothetical protein